MSTSVACSYCRTRLLWYSRRSEVWPHLTSSYRTSLASNSPAHHFQDSSSGVEMSTRQSTALPCRSVHFGHFSRGKASTTLCDDWNPSLAQSSDFHWPAELRGVRPRNLEQSTPFATRPRTVAEQLQAPAEAFSSMREPSFGTVVTDRRVRRRIQISGLISTHMMSEDRHGGEHVLMCLEGPAISDWSVVGLSM